MHCPLLENDAAFTDAAKQKADATRQQQRLQELQADQQAASAFAEAATSTLTQCKAELRQATR